jgi:hypothetical protein
VVCVARASLRQLSVGENTHTHTYTNTHIHKHTHTHTRADAHARRCTPTYTHTRADARTHKQSKERTSSKRVDGLRSSVKFTASVLIGFCA